MPPGLASTTLADALFARAVGSTVHEHLSQLAAANVPAEAVAAEARAVIAGFEGSKLAKRLAALEVIGREVPIVLEDATGLWKGSIDLLGREADGTLVVIDYKTDAELEGAAARHEPQLAVYVNAVRRAVPGSRVRAELWMLRHGVAIPIELRRNLSRRPPSLFP
jgi:ATP-dependent exoDNAse (exonuclease V) beta subunit